MNFRDFVNLQRLSGTREIADFEVLGMGGGSLSSVAETLSLAGLSSYASSLV